jgi:pyruvate/2-oxoglutarate dehydrogenase complex dihydrolipoamide dehydrogenase (E3) component
MSTQYDLIVIGGGAAGLTAAGLAAHLGARTLLVEEARLGGECTWTGCIPSKALVRAAHVAHTVRGAGAFGVRVGDVAVDFPAVMAAVRGVRRHVYEEADAPGIYTDMGIDVRQGTASFVDARSIQLSEGGERRVFSARKFVVATGARPDAPDVEGIEGVPYLTNETIFDLEALPAKLVVLGAGPVGIELAQAFRRLGSAVTVVDVAPRILAGDDAELAGMLQDWLEREGVRFLLDARIRSAGGRTGDLTLEIEGSEAVLGSELLVASGRVPNVQGLRLDAAGVAYDDVGILIDERCRTSRSHIFAAGDVTGRFPFTHMAEHMARIAVSNALLKTRRRIDLRHVPWVTFTDPELAQVGATERELHRRGPAFETFRFPYEKLDRAITERRDIGMIKVHARGWNGRILGATVLGARAGELICELALAMHRGVRLRQISDTIHPYPSYGMGVRRAADEWYVRRRSAGVVRLVRGVFGYRGSVLE